MSTELTTATRRRIPLSVPTFRGNEREYLVQCIDSGFVSSVGPMVTKFERSIADYVGAREAIACVNGTAAIHLALLGVGVERDMEVIVPSLTFVGSINPIMYCGAHPVFVDVDPATVTIAPEALKALLAERYQYESTSGHWISRVSGRPLGAVLGVDLFGHPADFDAIAEIVAPYGVPLVEDGAEGLGASCRGRRAGNLARVGALSFNGNKVITTGGGGMVVTDDETLAKQLRHLSTQARDHRWEYHHDEVGFNYRLTNLQAALGLAQLEQLDGFLAIKRAHAERYRAALTRYNGITMLTEQSWARSGYWLVAVYIESIAHDRAAAYRLFEQASEAGIEIRPFFSPAHLQIPYRGDEPWSLPATEHLFARAVNLPSSVDLTDEEIDYVVETVARLAGLSQRPE